MPNDHPPASTRSFAEVLEQELRLIRLRREAILHKEQKRLEMQAEAAGKLLEPLPAATGGVPAAEMPVRPEGVRAADDADARLTRARIDALGEHLAAIAFSGGGIRSGTFAVGLLQGLASLGLLRRFDYLSTVSGGGYAGGWLAAWLKREGDVRNVERQLAPSRVVEAAAVRPPLHDAPTPAVPDPPAPVVDEEPEPIHHLREYSSYMAPRLGLLTADTWTIIMIWVRNVSVNLLMFLPLAMGLVLALRLLVYSYGSLTSQAIENSTLLQYVAWAPLAFGFVLYVAAFTYNGRALGEFRRERNRAGRVRRPLRDEGEGVYYGMVYPLMAAALLLSLGLRPVIWWIGTIVQGRLDRAPVTASSNPLSFGALREWVIDSAMSNLGLLGWPNVVVHAVTLGILMALFALALNRSSAVKAKFVVCAFFAGATGGVLLTVVENLLKTCSDAGRPDLAALLGTPALLLVIAASLIVEVALLGRTITEAEREWWSRFGALVFIGGLLWLIGSATVLYVPALFVGAGLVLRLAITSGWLATTAAGVFAGRNANPKAQKGQVVLKLITVVAPPVFLLGLLGAVSLLGAFLVNDPPLAFPSAGHEVAAVDNYLQGVRDASALPIIVWLVLFGLLGWLGSSLIDVNLFSLNAMYANRLIRCYLGASRPKTHWARRWGGLHDPTILSGAPTDSAPPDRDQNPVTGFDPDDDIDLLDLQIGYENAERPGHVYSGPHLLVNASLNLVGGQELAWRDRKGESFTLSPLYCGAKGTGFALVDERSRRNLTLGRAISISGAAVDPNMRFYQSAALTALLTVLNARLGYWMRNPSRPGWEAESPKYGNLLFTEFLGRTDGKGDFVHLSDGGHFENMGVYELIRRRCRYIVACDAGEDTGPSDENLAILLRLCRIDFGVRIELDTTPLRVEGPDGLSHAHVVIGRVRYDDVDSGQVPGVLVYLKISMTGDEPADVQQYAESEPAFPHQPTDLRQSFTEDQFESYRALGEHIARGVFEDAVSDVRSRFWRQTDARQEFAQGNRRLFAALQGRWAGLPAKIDERYEANAGAWAQFQRDVRRDPNLAALTEDLYPELRSERAAAGVPPPPAPAPDPSARRAELHAVAQMLQIMEDAWLELGLKGRSDLPMNRGWMNALRRWASTEAFRQFWPLFRSEYNPDFVDFVEDELHIGKTQRVRELLSAVLPATFARESVDLLAEEFAREWPGEVALGRDLRTLINRANHLNLRGTHHVWLILQSPASLPAGGQPPERFVSGIILLAEWGDEQGNATPGVFEFFAWVRPPHRAAGLGTECIEPALGEVIELLKRQHANNPLELRARYPKSGRDGDDDQERSRWLSFFALYDFQPVSPVTTTVPFSQVVRTIR
jgi:hypothetical protein